MNKATTKITEFFYETAKIGTPQQSEFKRLSAGAEVSVRRCQNKNRVLCTTSIDGKGWYAYFDADLVQFAE